MKYFIGSSIILLFLSALPLSHAQVYWSCTGLPSTVSPFEITIPPTNVLCTATPTAPSPVGPFTPDPNTLLISPGPVRQCYEEIFRNHSGPDGERLFGPLNKLEECDRFLPGYNPGEPGSLWWNVHDHFEKSQRGQNPGWDVQFNRDASGVGNPLEVTLKNDTKNWPPSQNICAIHENSHSWNYTGLSFLPENPQTPYVHTPYSILADFSAIHHKFKAKLDHSSQDPSNFCQSFNVAYVTLDFVVGWNDFGRTPCDPFATGPGTGPNRNADIVGITLHNATNFDTVPGNPLLVFTQDDPTHFIRYIDPIAIGSSPLLLNTYTEYNIDILDAYRQAYANVPPPGNCSLEDARWGAVELYANTRGHRIDFTFKHSDVIATPQSSALPDFVIPNITWDPPNPAIGQPIAFTVTNDNRGAAPTSDGTFYGANVTAENTANPTGPVNTGAWVSTTEGFAIGDRKILTTPDERRWTPPSAGTYEIRGIADDQNRIVESSETNNRSAPFFLTVAEDTQAPDLFATSISFSWFGGSVPVVGDSIFAFVTLRNIGTRPSGEGCRQPIGGVCFHGTSFSVDSAQVPGWFTGTLATMAVNEFRQFGPTQSSWTATAGTHTIGITVDDNDLIQETFAGELNNFSTALLTIFQAESNPFASFFAREHQLEVPLQ